MPNPFDFDSVAGANVLDGTKASGGMGFTPPAGLRMPSAQPQQSALQASQQVLQKSMNDAYAAAAPQQQSGVVAYNPQTLEVDTGAGTFSLDNLSVADAHIQKGWLTQPVQQVKPGYIPVAPQEIERLFQEKAQSRGFGSAVAETGRQIWQGFSHDLPSMAIGATRAFADAGGDYDRWGKWAQNTLENDARVPDTYGRGVVSTDLIKGGRALAPSAAAMAATAVNPIVGGALTLGMFGGSQFTDTWDKAKAAGLPDGDAFTAALQTGAIEGLGETLADVAGVKLLSGAAPVLRNLINGGRLSVDQAIKIVTNPSMLKSFSADIAANTAIQAGTEYGQNYGETAVENAYGISKENPHAQGMEGFHSALGLSALMAPLGVPGHYAAAQARAQLGAAIKDYSNPVDLLEASRAVRDEITPLTGEAPAGDWMRNQFNQYNNQYLTGLSNGYRDQYVNNFMDGVNAAPKDFGFEGPEISPVTQYLRGQQMQVNAFSPNNQAVPLPTNVGEAVAAIQQLRNYPIVEGSPEHAAVLEASRILNEAGVNLPAPAAPKGQPNASANQELPNAVNPQAALATAVAGVDQGNNPVTNPAGAGQETQPAKIAGEENEAGLTSPRAVALWQRAVNAFGPRAIELEQISQLLAENKFGKVEKMLGEQQAAAAAPTGAVSEDATHNVFEKLLKTLKQRKGAADKQAVMRAWLSEEASLAGIASQFGISKQRVQQVTQEAVQQMIANAKQAGLTAEHAKAMLRGILEASMGSSTAGMTERQQAIASLTGAVQDNYGEVMDFADAAQHGLVVPNRVTQTGTRGANEGEWSDSERQGSEGEKVSETVAEEAPTEDAEPTKDEGEIPLISEETAGEEEPEERSREINATGEGKEVSSADPEQLAKEAADAKARQKADVDKANARIKLLRDAGKVFDSIPLDGMADNVMWEDLNRDQQSRFAEAYDNDATDDELAALAQEIGDEAGHFMGKDGVLFSKNKASEPTTVAALTKKLQKLFFTPKRFADLVVTVQSAEDLTKIPEARSIDVGKDTQGFVYKGKVYLIADNIDKGTELAVFLHELGAHLGMKNLIGESNFHQLALQINEWSGKSGDRLEHRLAQLAMARVDNALQLAEERGEPIDDGTLLEEMVAYFIEEAVNAGVNPMALDKTNGPLREWFRTLWAAVKSALRKIGFARFDDLTAQNIVDLAYGAAKMELTGERTEGSDKVKFSFAGPKATNANIGSLEKAQELLDSGAGEESVWKQTGWFQGADGKWRFEISDADASFKNNGETFGEIVDGSAPLAEVLNHPALYEAYPDIKDLKVVPSRSQNGGVYKASPSERIVIDSAMPREEALSTLIHEVQHAIQQREGFAKGGSPNLIAAENTERNDMLAELGRELNDAVTSLRDSHGRDAYRALMQAVREDGYRYSHISFTLGNIDEDSLDVADLVAVYAKNNGLTAIEKAADAYVQVAESLVGPGLAIDKEKAAFDVYQRLAGEVEARNVEARRDGNSAATFPRSTEDRSRDKQIVKMTGDEGAAAKNPATPEGFMNTLRGVIEDPVSAFKRNRLGWLTLEQLAEATKSKAVDAYRDALVKMQKFSKDYIYRASGVDQEWAKLSDKQQVTLSNVMRMARRAAFDPAKDSPANPEQTKVKLEYAKLDANGKKVYEAVRDFYAKGFEERKQIMMTLAQKAKDAGKNVKEVEALFAKVKGPYFPFMRLGDWYSVGMSDRVAELVQKRDAGELSSAEREELGKLRKDKKHYWTRSHDTEREAKAAVREMQKAGYANAYHNVQEERLSSELKKHNIDVSSLEESIVEGLDGATRSAVRDMLAQMAFDLLPEHHALKRQMHAELVEGEEENMRRVFAKSAISQAHYISRLKHADDVSAALQVVRNDGRYDVNKRHIYNELNKRTELAMQRTESPIVDKLMGLSYFAHLGMSPAFILTNLSQVPMITAPWLSARFGIGATSSALATALADTSSIMKTSFVGKGKSLLHELNWGNHFKQGSDEDKLLRELTDRNLLDITMEHDLNAVAEMSSSAMDKGFKYMNAPVRISELANRAVTALAAYRLARAHNQSHEEAVNTAAKALSDTQLNYSALNAPRYMQSVLGSKALAKMVFQFRKYQQGMLWLVGSNIYNAVKGDGAEAKYARNTLIGLYGMTGIAAGVTGMPLFGTLAFVLNTIAAAFGDPDDKWDLEVEMRNWLTDHFGKEAAAAIAKGLPMLLGTDLSKRVGMGDIASPLPFFRQGKSTQETAGNLLASAAGAPVATMVDLVDGLSMMASGDWMKGAEKVAPLKMAKDILRASRYGTEGLTSKTGEVVLPSERFNAWDLSLRAMGFSPTKESEYYAANAAVEGAKTAATDVRSKLLRDYAQAKLVEGDYQAVKDKIDAFNDRHPERGVRIDAGALIKAVQQRKRMAEQRDESGVKGDRVTKNFKEQGRFAAP